MTDLQFKKGDRAEICVKVEKDGREYCQVWPVVIIFRDVGRLKAVRVNCGFGVEPLELVFYDGPKGLAMSLDHLPEFVVSCVLRQDPYAEALEAVHRRLWGS